MKRKIRRKQMIEFGSFHGEIFACVDIRNVNWKTNSIHGDWNYCLDMNSVTRFRQTIYFIKIIQLTEIINLSSAADTLLHIYKENSANSKRRVYNKE